VPPRVGAEPVGARWKWLVILLVLPLYGNGCRNLAILGFARGSAHDRTIVQLEAYLGGFRKRLRALIVARGAACSR